MPLEQRVEQFEKTARYILKKLDQTLEQIKECDNESNAVEHMKLSIAPDAALILSQGDTLILETHGKNSMLTQRLLTIQKELRDKYKDVQNSNTTANGLNQLSMLEKSQRHDPENQYSPKEKVFVDKKFPADLLRSNSASKHVKLDDLVSKVSKRVYDLISKPVDRASEEELTKRILDIGVSKKIYFFLHIFSSHSITYENEFFTLSLSCAFASLEVIVHARSFFPSKRSSFPTFFPLFLAHRWENLLGNSSVALHLSMLALIV